MSSHSFGRKVIDWSDGFASACAKPEVKLSPGRFTTQIRVGPLYLASSVAKIRRIIHPDMIDRRVHGCERPSDSQGRHVLMLKSPHSCMGQGARINARPGHQEAR